MYIFNTYCILSYVIDIIVILIYFYILFGCNFILVSLESGPSFLPTTTYHLPELNNFFQQFEGDVSADESQPLQQKALQKAKLKRMKEVNSSQVMSDVLLYSVFLLLLLLVAYGHRDPIAYEMTKNLENQFSLSVRNLCFIHVVTVIELPGH